MKDTFRGDYGTATVSDAKRPAIPESLRELARLAGPFDVEAVRSFRGETLPNLLPYPLAVVAWGVETRSEANERTHWRHRQRRAKAQRAAVLDALWQFNPLLLAVGTEVRDHGARLAVSLTRMASRTLDSDNLQSALKAVRDEVAARLAVDDGHPGLAWEYWQQKGPPGVVIELEALTA